MNKIKRNKIIPVICLIVIILTLIILSNVVKALVNLDEIIATGQLSDFAANNAQEFIYDVTPGQIFTLNARNNKRGISVNGGDTYYKSTICIFHTQATCDNTKVMLTNVVDIEAPGDVIVYQYKSIEACSTGEVGTITENGNTITEITTLRENGTDKKYKVTYTKNKLDLSEAECEDFEKIAYLMNRSIEIGPDKSQRILSCSTEATIDWYWKDRIKDYIADRGLLDPYFDVDTYAPRDRPSYYSSEAQLATDAASNLIEVSLTKGETTPQVEYGDNGKAYIGPLQVEYEGGTTSLKVQGNSGEVSATWTTKNEDGSFNEEISENITSGQVFYAVVDESEIEGIDNVSVKVYLNYTKGYKARFALANNKTAGGQNLMFFAGNKDTQDGKDEEEWNVENAKPKYGDLIIHKTGDDTTTLQGVEFTIWKAQSADLGYLRLIQDSQFIETVNEEIDLLEYTIEYVGINELDRATKFVTNSDGKIVIRNLEYAKGSVDYNYWVGEEKNNHYGYKGMRMTIEDVTINGGTVEQVQTDADIEFSIGEEATEVILTIKNNPELAPLEIIKVGEDGTTSLEDVKFKIEIGTGEYLQLHDVNGLVTSSKGTITINKNNVAQGSQYAVKYVTNIEEATEFITDKDGKIIINNLEVNASLETKYTYTAHEIENPNYGYGARENTELKGSIVELKLNEVNQIKITNNQDLGNLELKKYDEDNHSIILPDVGFVIEISPSPENSYAYLALYNQNGDLEPSVKGTVTINRNNVAQDITTGKEYRVSYYCTDKQYSELTDEEKANVTVFLTGDDGTLKVNNLEVYSPKTKEKYTYKLIETSNSNYGYVADSVELGNVILETDKTTNQELGNQAVYTKISGYVWIENSAGKSNEYDGVYTEANTDVKLTDLYIVQNGELVKNPEAVTPVEVKLRDKTTGEFIKQLPDEFAEDGKYTFVDVEIDKLANYEVVFIYDGFYYTTIVEQLDKENGSKVKEVESERRELNNKFGTVKDNCEVVSTDGTVNTVEYYKDGHTSTLSNLNFDTNISANTTKTGYNLKEEYDKLKANTTTPVELIDNVNMGIVLREQPQISINSDIHSVLLDFEGYTYNYKYNGRQNYYENTNGDDYGVKFEEKYSPARYTQTVYASDIQAAADFNKEIKLSVTYKIQVSNESRTLNTMTRQIINYFDARYNIKAIGLGLDEETHTITNTISFSEPQNVEGHSEYKSTVIDFNQMIDSSNSGNSNIKTMYITFDIQRDAILDLLNQKSTYHNASEILSYTSYYGEETSKIDGIQFMTDQTAAGNVYAGIDKMSQPGNMEIILVDHSSGDGTKVLDTTNFEDDTTSAPSLLLEATEARKVSGMIWEDSITNTENDQKLGDGKYIEGENLAQNVKVGLYNSDDGTIATYSNGELAETITDANGNYTFGYKDEATNKYVGVLPGRYVIKYTYNNESYIVGKENVNPNEYKSTIITSEVIRNAFEGNNERWYIVEEDYRYSDARDDIELRPEYNSDIDSSITVTNSTYNNVLVIEYMDAYTPIMDIGIEFTETNEADALTTVFIRELEKVDFGIIERPDIDIIIEKEITGLEILAQNGTSIIPKGNPADPNAEMQYVRKLDGLVSAEIETDLLQGAKLSLEYSISVANNSDRDYLEPEYYYYGTGGVTETTTKVKKVVDYLDATMSLDPDQNQETIWIEVTADDLYSDDGNQENDLVSEEVYNELKTNNYSILITETFEEVGTGNEKTVKLYTTRYLAVSDSIREENRVEIIELTGKRTIKESIPGNYIPTESPSESGEDEEVLVITPPTGSTVNYVLYIIATIATFTILVLGIVIIKKKIVK